MVHLAAKLKTLTCHLRVFMKPSLVESHLALFLLPDPAWGSPPGLTAVGPPETRYFSGRTQSTLGLQHPSLLFMLRQLMDNQQRDKRQQELGWDRA